MHDQRAASTLSHTSSPVLPYPKSLLADQATRTVSLALSLSLGPALVSLVTSPNSRSRGLATGLRHILRRELGITGFPFAITLAIAGGSALHQAWGVLDGYVGRVDLKKWFGQRGGERLEELKLRLSKLPPERKAFVSYFFTSLLSIYLMQSRRRRGRRAHPASTPMSISPAGGDDRRISPTLDLTFLFMVRAIDALVQRGLFGRQEDETEETRDKRRRITTKIDALVFWASSARIMWCFFYEPSRLPRSYVKWIMSLANIDRRLVSTLQAIRAGDWSYTRGIAPPVNALADLSQALGYPRAWGEPSSVPAYGGLPAVVRWNQLGVANRGAVGGIPCEIVHGTMTGSSCSKNVALRGTYAFLEAFALYLPVHLLPKLLTNPRALLHLPKTLSILAGVLRSAAFLSAFVSSVWASVCLTRTVLLARLFPFISHDFWDGPWGCIMAGCLACGCSIWIEDGRRRSEIALYVLPRAMQTCLPNRLLRNGGRMALIVERFSYSLSLAYLLMAATYHPASLRGLAKWALAIVTKGGSSYTSPAKPDRICASNGHSTTAESAGKQSESS